MFKFSIDSDNDIVFTLFGYFNFTKYKEGVIFKFGRLTDLKPAPRWINQVTDDNLTITAADAAAVVKRLEYDASWDKCGSGYYVLKRQLKEREIK